MNLDTRITRRQRDTTGLVLDYEAISPVAHVAEPVGRGPVFETLLDYLDPVLDERLPPNTYIWGPAGAGKSAVVTALLSHLQPRRSRLGTIIHTATRTESRGDRAQSFVYVDARDAMTEFGLYHAILDGLVEDPIPTQGFKTETLRDDIRAALASPNRRALVVVDHVDEPGTYSLSTLTAMLDRLNDSLAWIAVGRTPPCELDCTPPAKRVEVPAYDHQTLVEIVTNRTMSGIGSRAVTHQQSRDIARWADGNAHDALAALFVAADRAAERNGSTVADADIAHATATIPHPCVSLAQVLLLPPTRQRVLRSLLDIPESDRSSVENTTTAIAADDSVDLSAGTLKRYLYELADDGIVERIRTDGSTSGRPPSRIEPRFPTQIFCQFYERKGTG